MAKVLGWVLRRWQEELEPVIRPATVAQEAELQELWERELNWWKQGRGLEGDSLRKPITQVRNLIRDLPVTEENSWFNPRTKEREHIALKVFNLSEGEWVRLNDRSRGVAETRLEHQQLLQDPDTIVQRALALLLSDEWPDLVVGIAVCTGRRLAEIMKTGRFAVKEPYTAWFSGQVKGRTRFDERYEIPTLARAFLVVDAVEKLRSLVDCSELEVEQVSQRYGRAVNEAVDQHYGDLIPVRVTREKLTVHALRAVYAQIATFWYAPPTVASITYMAQIQGHRFVLEPEAELEGEPAGEVEQVRRNYASHAHYADYKIADRNGNIDGRQGVKLDQPGVTVLDVFRKEAGIEEPQKPSRRKRKKASENKTGYSSLKPRVATRDWVDEIRTELQNRLGHEVSDDEVLRHLLVAYVQGRTAVETAAPPTSIALDTLDVPAQTRELLREGIALSGAADVLSFLVAAGEREARQLKGQARRHDQERYAAMPTSQLIGMKVVEAANERFRRAVWTLMRWNEQHRPLERWYITTLSIQKLVGGRKDAIKTYLDAHREEIEAHHRELDIRPSYNRKPEAIQDMIQVPEEAEAFPWGHAPAESAD
ncbi:telomere resolvase [Thermosporothrix hazakensis]|jgi:hypothetical protein|uniref:Telomere resolvase n=2 Tax=Thermosporothrix TaxID=768650 RepID=A0A326U8P1_THEHA|nr:protelomerase family protein [Thermosporothrix hazakensis]PZW31180.1 telomere resolvase [Thermosporothrix hazakensis]BBH86600.1 hypothetical protein KTC_13510 [Thermosporothrix sp. COM3]GCE50909.1 hypothetical protein KTH_57780 [Thermosporothrix hazakensis]